MPTPTYRDIDFNFGKINEKFISIKQNENDVIQSIKNIILSSDGEVPFKTGRVGLLERKFQNLDIINIKIIEASIRSAIEASETRVEVSGVTVSQQGSTLIANVVYKMKDVPGEEKELVLKSEIV